MVPRPPEHYTLYTTLYLQFTTPHYLLPIITYNLFPLSQFFIYTSLPQYLILLTLFYFMIIIIIVIFDATYVIFCFYLFLRIILFTLYCIVAAMWLI